MTPNILPQWRTSTVVALCQSMREEGDYSALPILADALQDADCDDLSFLTALRSHCSPVDAERYVALIYSDETANAVAWVEQLAAELGDSYGYDDDESGDPTQRMSYSILIDAARGSVTSGECLTQYGSENWRNTMQSRYAEFWNRYQLITATKPEFESEYERSFISCSC